MFAVNSYLIDDSLLDVSLVGVTKFFLTIGAFFSGAAFEIYSDFY